MEPTFSAREPVRFLVIDRDRGFRRVLRELATAAAQPVEIIEADGLDEVPPETSIDAVLIESDGPADIGRAAAIAPVIAVSGSGSLTGAVAAMRAGAADYLVKPVRPETILESLGRVLRGQEDVTTGVGTRGFQGFIGASQVMRGVLAQLARIAPSRAPVFITGESGTGKELAAEAIHARSGRTGSFVAINCAAIPRELMESELFGHARGAFTGAQEDRKGAVELSDKGTLFLDEICEMEPGLQTKLLRFVQSRSVRRIGEGHLRHVDVRIVCATNRDPAAEVAAGRFRADLYYRLHVLPVHLPALRERAQDILPLAEAFLAEFAVEEGRTFTGFDSRAKDLLVGYDWPGNVRQLQNVVRRAVVMNDGAEIAAEMLALALTHSGGSEACVNAAPPAGDTPVEPYWLQERRIIERALNACGGHVGRAAAALEISPSTIYRKKQGWQAA